MGNKGTNVQSRKEEFLPHCCTQRWIEKAGRPSPVTRRGGATWTWPIIDDRPRRGHWRVTHAGGVALFFVQAGRGLNYTAAPRVLRLICVAVTLITSGQLHARVERLERALPIPNLFLTRSINFYSVFFFLCRRNLESKISNLFLSFYQ